MPLRGSRADAARRAIARRSSGPACVLAPQLPAPAIATVTRMLSPGADLFLGGPCITWSVQTYAGDVPLVKRP